MMNIDEAVVDLSIERRRSVLAWTATPPKPVAVHLVVGPEQHRHMRIAQLPQVACDHVHLRAPAVIEGTAGREQFMPLIVGQVALYAVAEGDRLIIGGPDGVPGQGDPRPVLVLPFSFFAHPAAGGD